MNILSFEVPTVMKHGLGASRSVAYEAKDLGMRRPLLVTDPGIQQIGLLDQLIAILDAGNLDHVVFSEVKPNPSITLVDQVAAIFKNERCDGLIALGGGSSMDTAKAVGVVVEHGGSILDYEWAPLSPIKKRIPPTICLPTTAGTGSEVTLWAVITDPERKIKFNVGGSPLIGAWLALIDPELTMELPPAITAGTGMDALAHAVENYTMTYAQPLSDSAALLAMEYIGDYLRVAYAQGNNAEARYKMSMAAMLAGLAYGTVSAGAAHAMSQSAGGLVDAPHGPLTGRLLGPVMRYNMMAEPRKFARIAQALGEDIRGLSMWQAAERAVEAVMRLSQDLEIPSLQALGFKEEAIPLLAEIAYKDPQTIGNPRLLTVESYRQIYQWAFDLGK